MDKYIVITQWMISDLQLKGSELIAFALIHGLTIHETDYHGTAEYLSTWLGITPKKCYRVLDSLCEKKLIRKTAYSRTDIHYESLIDEDSISKFQNGTMIVPKRNHDSSKTELCDSSKTEPNNSNIYNIEDNSNDNTIPPKDISPKKQTKFVKPTIEQIKIFITLNGYELDAEQFYDYYESNGWKVGRTPMKSWEAAIRNWVRMDKKRAKENGIYQSRQRQDSRRQGTVSDFANAKPEDFKF